MGGRHLSGAPTGAPDNLEEVARALQALRGPLTRLVLAREEGRRAGAASGASLSSPQHLALAALAPEPLAMSALAARTGVAVSTATRMAQGLARAGLVDAAPASAGDRRRRYVAITAAGRTAMERESAAQIERLRTFLAPMTDAERQSLRAGLEVFTEALGRLEREGSAPPER